MQLVSTEILHECLMQMGILKPNFLFRLMPKYADKVKFGNFKFVKHKLLNQPVFAPVILKGDIRTSNTL